MRKLRFFAPVLLAFACSPSEKQIGPPNIIIIMTDDHAKNAVSAYGSSLIHTANIDRIGKEGIRFDQAFVTNSLCGPARAVALTGKYSHLNGFRDNNDSFDNSQETFPKILQRNGYYTAVVGKWHLVTEPKGFDFWKILINQGQYYNPDFVEQGDTVQMTGYSTDLVTDIALSTLDKRPKDKPFVLMLNQKAPHRNWMPHLKNLGMYDSVDLPVPANFFDDYATRTAVAREQDMEIRDLFHSYDLKLMLPPGTKDPGTGGHPGGGADAMNWWAEDIERFTPDQKKLWDDYYKPISDEFYKSARQGKDLENWMYQRYIKDYLSCVASVDENIGRVLDYLDTNGLAENTLIIYLSDQGFFLGEHGWYDKRFMYEESLGIPLLMRWPAKIKAGQVNKSLALNLDIAPTILDATIQAVPDWMQGRSLLTWFDGTHAEPIRNSLYYHYYEFPYGAHKVKKHYGIRTDRYKLIHFYNDIDEWELFDLKTDPSEMKNLYGDDRYKRLSDSLKNELYALKKSFLDTVKLETAGR